MIKIYRWNEYKNHAEVIMRAPGGCIGKLIFDNGNTALRVLPTVRVTSEFWQQVIEGSNYYKRGFIKCVQIFNDEETDNAEESTQESYNPVEEVVSLQQAVDFIADNYEEKAHTINEALKIAHNHGVDFPNLKKRK